MQDNTNMKQQFIAEVMLFSPKYNYSLARQLADYYPEEELKSLFATLVKINEKKYDELDLLSEKDPAIFEQKLAEEKEIGEKADTFFYGNLEKNLLQGVDEDEKLLNEIDEDMERSAEETELAVDDQANLAQSLLHEVYSVLEEAGNIQETKAPAEAT